MQTPLSKEDYLLVCIAEECGELQQQAGKALRFGLDNVNPHKGKNNRELIRAEFFDICAIYNLMVEAGMIEFTEESADTLTACKTERTLNYMEYSREVGRLEPCKIKPPADGGTAPQPDGPA